MAERVNCPECQAHLFLPSLLGEETAQCPRCQHVFAPTTMRAELKRLAAPEEEESEYCEPERLVPPGPLGGQWKAAFACVMLGLCVLTDALQAWVQLEQIEIVQLERKIGIIRHVNFIRAFRRQQVPPNPQQVELEKRTDRHRTVSAYVGPACLLCNLAAMISTLIWIGQACLNLKLLRADGCKFTPFGSVVVFFVPIVNLILPYAAVMEIWRASDPTAVRSAISWQTSPYASSIRVWWFFFLAAVFFPLIGMICGPQLFNRDSEVHALALSFVMCIFLACACATMIYVIRGIAIRQRARYESLFTDPE